jgi:hypothetical protein
MQPKFFRYILEQQQTCSYLRVNQQRPASRLADDNGVINGEAVIWQAIKKPASDGHRLTQHSSKLEGARARNSCRSGDKQQEA